MGRFIAAALTLFIAICLQAVTATTGWSQGYCSPKTNAARILIKPTANAIHPDWRGDNYVGTAWTLTPKRTVTNVTGTYALGDLHSGHTGGIVNRNVFILLSEWDCTGSISGEPTASAPKTQVAVESTQPSFNCNVTNLNDAERTVCGNAELSRLDANMSSTYD
jgi:hypothetical protein